MPGSADGQIDPNALNQLPPFDASLLFDDRSQSSRLPRPSSPSHSEQRVSLTSASFDETAELLGLSQEYRELASKVINNSTPENQFENYICISTAILQAVRSRPSPSELSPLNKRQRLSWDPDATYVDWLNATTRDTLLNDTVQSYSEPSSSDPVAGSIDRLVWDKILNQGTLFKKAHFPEGFDTPSGGAVTRQVKSHMRLHPVKNAKAELRTKLLFGVLAKNQVRPNCPVPVIDLIYHKVHNYCVDKSKVLTQEEISQTLEANIKLRIILLVSFF
ncbi:hypothetical protein DFH28DRAFT_884203 [Melampsora americana]|nr:hypothetical protein DFH28DRAFT_884203 [Melampsora americana]